MHNDGEIVSEFRSVGDVNLLLVLLAAVLRLADLGKVHVSLGLTSLSLDEGENGGLVVVGVDVGLAETSAVTLKELVLLTFEETELDVSVDGLSTVGRADTAKDSPLLGGVDGVTQNLDALLGKSSGSVEGLHVGSSRIDVDMVNTVRSNESELGETDPLPELDLLSSLDTLELLLSVEVVDLNNQRFRSFIARLQSNNVLSGVHDKILASIGSARDTEVVLKIHDGELALSIWSSVSDGEVLVGLES